MPGTKVFDYYSDSDDESVATNSTAESDPEETYTVEKILLERTDDSGELEYLLKWQGYALDRATWEPRENIESETLLQDWRKQKRRIEAGAEKAFDEDLWLQAMELAADQTATRRSKREKKRKRRLQESLFFEGEPSNKRRRLTKRRTTALADSDDDYEDTVPKLPGRRHSTSAATFDNITVSPRPSPKRLASTPVALKTKNALAAEVSSAKPATTLPSRPLPIPTEPPTNKIIPPTNPTSIFIPKPGAKAQPNKFLTAGRKSAPTAAPKFSSLSGQTGAKFTKLSIQHRVQQSRRNEPAPDPSKLIMVDPKTGRIEPPISRPSSPLQMARKEIASVYGRRAPEPEKRPPSPSPEPERENERDTPHPDISIRSGYQIIPDGRKFTICKGCTTSFDQCPYSHSLPISKKAVACFFWLVSKCTRNEADCHFAHRDTGIYIGPPLDHSAIDIVPYITAKKTQNKAAQLKSAQAPRDEVPRVVLPARNIGKDATCFYWAMGGCSRNEEDCFYAHSPKLLFVGPPRSYRGEVDMNGVMATFFPLAKLKGNNQDLPVLPPRSNTLPNARIESITQEAKSAIEPRRNSVDVPVKSTVNKSPPLQSADPRLRRRASIGSKPSPKTTHAIIEAPVNQSLTKSGQNRELSLDCTILAQEADAQLTAGLEQGEIVESPCDTPTTPVAPVANMIAPIGPDEPIQSKEPKIAPTLNGPQLTLLTDDLIYYHPSQATSIINTHLSGHASNKIAARPNLMKWILHSVCEKGDSLSKTDGYVYEDLYSAVNKLCSDTANIFTPGWEHYAELWEQDQSIATSALMDWFASFSVTKKQNGEFRGVNVCHLPKAETSDPNADQLRWEKAYPHMDFLAKDAFVEGLQLCSKWVTSR